MRVRPPLVDAEEAGVLADKLMEQVSANHDKLVQVWPDAGTGEVAQAPGGRPAVRGAAHRAPQDDADHRGA